MVSPTLAGDWASLLLPINDDDSIDWAPVGTRLRRPCKSIDAEAALQLRPIARDLIPEIMLD